MYNQPLITTRQWHLANIHLALQQIGQVFPRDEPFVDTNKSLISHDGGKTSTEEVLAELLTPVLPNIGGEPTRKGLIDLHRLISGDAASMSSNFEGS